MRDRGLAIERTALSRRRTVLPFLVVAVLGARAALEHPVGGLTVALLAGAGAAVLSRRSPTLLTLLVVGLAAAAALLPTPA